MIFNDQATTSKRCRWITLLMCVALVGGSYGWIQGVAWIGMTVKGVQQYQSLSLALDKTFSGTAPCSLCKAISENKSESGEGNSLATTQKYKEVPLSLNQVIIRPNRSQLAILPDLKSVSHGHMLQPETPPPRQV